MKSGESGLAESHTLRSVPDSPRDWRRVALFVSRVTQMTREFYSGIMAYAAQHPRLFVRVFEVGANGDSPMIDFGELDYPDAAIVCDVPARFVRSVLNRVDRGNIPIVGFMESDRVNYDIGGDYECRLIARESLRLFRRCGCVHVGYFGTHNPHEIRISRAFWRNFSKYAEKNGMPASTIRRDVHDLYFVRSHEARKIADWIRKMPKPCGIIAYDDVLAVSVLNICRLEGLKVPDEVNVLGIGNDQIICEAARPSVSSVVLDYPHTGYLAAKYIDLALDGKPCADKTLSCGVKMIIERGSTTPRAAPDEVVERALQYIRENACRPGGIDQTAVAGALGVSVRMLQLRFHEHNSARTVLQEIQKVQLDAVCLALSTTDDSIEDITFSAGFRSRSRLKVLFHRVFGMSMREWRKKHRK